MANKVRKYIREEVGDSWFCIMVDESRDESKKEQMAIVLRFVDAKGVIREIFLNTVHVENTIAATLKASLWNRILNQNFDTRKIHGQGYDGSSNMSGEWNGSQALVRQHSPYAYYIHCFAHRLQLALVCVSKQVDPVHEFFDKLAYVINVVCASSKCHDELQKAKANEIKELPELGEIKSGKGKNQGVMDDKPNNTRPQRGDAQVAYTHLKSFEFVFVLHMMKEVMQKTDALSQGLQKKSQDILNAMESVSATKINIGDIVLLVEKYYPMDFIEQEGNQLRCQVETFQVERIDNSKLSKVATLSDLCQTLVETGKNSMYDLVERVCRLLLTLPVSTTTTERGFSAMKILRLAYVSENFKLKRMDIVNNEIIKNLSKIIESFEKKTNLEKEMADKTKSQLESKIMDMHLLLLEEYQEIDLLEEELILTRRRHDLAAARVNRFEREYPLEAKSLFPSKGNSTL
uniref:zinc finger MYM-type protein 1-like n=1 Tax=Erigeron canadensis TaxID=72917 RepID=UPI001CB937DC|nr:zinc finger MYM-type protein 1-like [Erigeron canadensis]